MPVGLSAAAAPTKQTRIGCNIRRLPKVVNFDFPAKAVTDGALSP
jgi:hypothetical protein